LTLLIPLVFLVIMIITYYIYIRTLTNQ
jgi:hypothetical protein